MINILKKRKPQIEELDKTDLIKEDIKEEKNIIEFFELPADGMGFLHFEEMLCSYRKAADLDLSHDVIILKKESNLSNKNYKIVEFLTNIPITNSMIEDNAEKTICLDNDSELNKLLLFGTNNTRPIILFSDYKHTKVCNYSDLKIYDIQELSRKLFELEKAYGSYENFRQIFLTAAKNAIEMHNLMIEKYNETINLIASNAQFETPEVKEMERILSR